MTKRAVFLCFGLVMQLCQTDSMRGWRSSYTYTKFCRFFLLYLIKAQIILYHITGIENYKPCWHIGAIYCAGGSEEVSSLLQPQRRASRCEGGEVSHYTVVYLLFHGKKNPYILWTALNLQWKDAILLCKAPILKDPSFAITMPYFILGSPHCCSFSRNFQYYLKY